MANPRRTSHSNTPTSPSESSSSSSSQPQSKLSSIANFLRRPHAFPFLLCIFVLLTWVSLRLQHQYSQQQPHQFKQKLHKLKSGDDDGKANLVRFKSGFLASKDKRGWLLNPVNAALDSGLLGGAVSCTSAHVGQIRPGGMRGNHRHLTCNETFIIWGAETKFRLENPTVKKGYAQVTIGPEEVAVACSPKGIAHALVNVDPVRTTFFLGCQDNVVTYHNSTTDFKVWKDL